MTKKVITVLSIFGVVMVIIPGINPEILSSFDFSLLMFLPLDILNRLMNYLSFFNIVPFNIMMWCLLILFSFFPMIHLQIKKKRIIKESGLWIGILCSVNLLILYLFFNGVIRIDSYSPNISYPIVLKIVGLYIYSSLLMIYYGAFKKEYGTVEAIAKFLLFGISVGIIITIGSSVLPFVELISYEVRPRLGVFLLLILELIFKVYTARVLLKFYDLINGDLSAWRSESFKNSLKDFKDFSKKYIQISVSFMFVSSLLVLANISNVIELNINIVSIFVTFVMVMLVMYFVEVISYGSEVQEENDGFI